MSTENKNVSALVISSDQSVVETIISNKSGDQEFIARESAEDVLSDTGILNSNGIVIYDVDNTNGDTNKAIDQAIKLKQADPTQVLTLVGEKEALADILKSNIQPLVYRAFNKPINANQVMLAFKSAHKLHLELLEKRDAGEDIMSIGSPENRTTIDSLAADRKKNPAIYIGIAIVALLAVGALLFTGGGDDTRNTNIADRPNIIADEILVEDVSETVSRTNELNQFGANALFDGRYVLPKGDNALEYFDQVLEIDPYDTTAYEGRKQVAEALRSRYQESINTAQFETALNAVASLRQIEPLNPNNDQLVENLNKAVLAHASKVQASGTPEEVAATTAVLDKIGDQVAGSKAAAAALKAEQALITRIDKAIESGNIVPPQKGNAYQLISDALKAKKISKINSQPRVKALSANLLALANQSFEEENIEATSKLSALVKRLNVDRPGLKALTTKVQEREATLAAEKAQQEQESGAEDAAEAAPNEEVALIEEPAKIIPAKIISRSAPSYPTRAARREIEGWVNIGFDIDANGEPINVIVLEAEPAGTFDTAAIKSVKKWRFSPARNESTGEAVESTNVSTKVNFVLE